MGLRDLVYAAYEHRLARTLGASPAPRHVGVILDGNRRWARSAGLNDPADVYRAGARKIEHFLGWCDDAGVEVVTLWLLSTDNLHRPPEELHGLLQVIEAVATDLSGDGKSWRLNLVGALDLLPADSAARLKETQARTAERTGATVNVAVGYGGRHEIADAVRSLLHEHAGLGTSIEELAGILDVDHIAEHLYTRGQPDPDLVIRTSGEQRLSGFLLWQSAHSEFYFCDAYWPDFRRVDFLRALRNFSARQRRFGG